MLTLVIADMDNVVSGLNEALLKFPHFSPTYIALEGILMDLREIEHELVDIDRGVDDE